MDKEEVRRAYDRLAPWYDLLEALPDRLLGVAGWRRRLAARARGRGLLGIFHALEADPAPVSR